FPASMKATLSLRPSMRATDPLFPCSFVPCLLPVLGLDKVMGHILDKGHRAWRHGHIAAQHVLEVLRRAEVNLGVIPVLAHAGAVEVDAGKQALVARVAEQLGVHLPIGRGLAGATHRSGCGRGVATDFELVLQQVLDAAIVNGYQDEVSGLAADLEPERAASHADEYRRAPSMAGAAGYHALTILRAEYECAFYHARHNGDASGG